MKHFDNWSKIFCNDSTPLTEVLNNKNIKILVKRDELNHPIIQGNKLRKLKYNIKYAIENGFTGIATFGGAYSNHLIAVAKCAELINFECVGFIRGNELESQPEKWSDTLHQAHSYGMKFIFLNREEYRKKANSKIVKSTVDESCYLIPEGGSNSLALKGVAEVIGELTQQTSEPTHIISACGTGGTLAGLIEGVNKANWNTQVIGIPVLKGAEFLVDDIAKLTIHNRFVQWKLYHDYHAGGYAKLNDERMIDFARNFIKNNKIDLDKIYTIKSFYAAYDMIEKGIIPASSKVVILHTGGLQGGIVT